MKDDVLLSVLPEFLFFMYINAFKIYIYAYCLCVLHVYLYITSEDSQSINSGASTVTRLSNGK